MRCYDVPSRSASWIAHNRVGRACSIAGLRLAGAIIDPMPRILADSLAEHRTLVRTRILDAFGAELHENGYAALTLAHVANRAGIARNTIYNYAADKNDLMLEFVERSVEEYMERARGEMAVLDSASERMRYLIRSQIEGFLAEPGAGSASGMLEGGSLPPAVFESLMKRLSAIHRMIAEVVEQGTRSGEFHRVTDVPATVEMIGSVIGSQRMPVGEGTRSVEEAVTHVSAFVMAALMA